MTVRLTEQQKLNGTFPSAVPRAKAEEVGIKKPHFNTLFKKPKNRKSPYMLGSV